MRLVSVSTAWPSPAALSRTLLTGGAIVAGLCLLIGPGCRHGDSTSVAEAVPVAGAARGQVSELDHPALEEARRHLAASTAEHQRKDRELAELRARCERLQRRLDTVQAYINAGGAENTRLPRHLRQRLTHIARVYGDWVRFDADAGTLVLQSDFTFLPGKSTLTPDATAALEELAAALIDPSPRPISVVVAAHTDRKPISLGEPAHDRDRFSSAEHAMSVVETLTENGVAIETLAIAAWGGARPLAGNEDPSGRFANRRIELQITLRAPDPSTTAVLDWNDLLAD